MGYINLPGVSSSNIIPPGSDKQITFNDNGTLAADIGFIYDKSTGNVGIGTIVPDEKLHITGDFKIESTGPDIKFFETDSSPNENYKIVLSAGKLKFRTDNDTFSSPSTTMTLIQNGDVGIGTASPTKKLHVVTAGNPAKFESTSGNGRIEIDAPSTKNAGLQFFENNVLRWGIFNQGTDDSLKFQNKDFATRMIVQQGGNVGIGTNSPASILSFKMGDGTGQAQASGVANVNTTSIGNVGSGEDDLMTYSLPADSLNTDGKSIKITAWGTITTSNSKIIRLKFGSITIQQIGPTTSGGLDWKIEGLVIRTGAATQKALGTQFLDTLAQDSTISSPTETLSSIVVIKVTGEGVANDDIKQEGMLVEYLN